jgi:hypothetical protein
MNSTQTFETLPDSPITVQVNVDFGTPNSIALPHPNGTDILLFHVASGGPIYQFNGTTWSEIGTHQLGGQFWIGFTVHEYGVIVFLKHPGGTGTPSALIYKPGA